MRFRLRAAWRALPSVTQARRILAVINRRIARTVWVCHTISTDASMLPGN
jgi:hypothetical protein